MLPEPSRAVSYTHLDVYKRQEQIVAGIISKGQPVRPVIDKSVLGGKIVIAAVQFGYLRPDVGTKRKLPGPFLAGIRELDNLQYLVNSCIVQAEQCTVQ